MGIGKIQEKINAFWKRYYLNLLVRGLILTFAILFVYFLVATLLEYMLWLSPWLRFLIFVVFFGVAAYCILRFLKGPIAFWISRKGIGNEQSARIIGSYIPSINDRLVNLIQLAAAQESSLAYASIQQKTLEFEPVSFASVIRLNQNKKHLKYLLIPVVLILVLMIFNGSIITR
jgi:hypothetical protein